MVVFGLILVAVGVVLALLGVLTADTESQTKGGTTEVHATYAGIDVTASTLFLIGLIAGLLIVLGLWITKHGAQAGWRRRKEQKRLDQQHDRLEEADRREGGRERREDERY